MRGVFCDDEEYFPFRGADGEPVPAKPPQGESSEGFLARLRQLFGCGSGKAYASYQTAPKPPPTPSPSPSPPVTNRGASPESVGREFLVVVPDGMDPEAVEGALRMVGLQLERPHSK